MFSVVYSLNMVRGEACQIASFILFEKGMHCANFIMLLSISNPNVFKINIEKSCEFENSHAPLKSNILEVVFIETRHRVIEFAVFFHREPHLNHF